MSLVGHHIGRYRILEQIGSGGMSVVYKGVDTALEREVAVKVLHPHLAGKEDSRKRLAREAQAVAKLQHPNILEVFDFAAGDSDTAYIVTEFIRGQTLRQCAEKHPFSPPEIAAMAIHEIAAALAHAHEAGIIHRDLKPENVMVRDDGVIKLMDFGIAKILDREDRMTMTGALVGSPAHMAPEIIEGREVGPEADVFSLGTMLYYFATGVLPFVGPNATATLKKILDGAYEDPRKLTPAIGDRLAEIIGTCLARQPSDRYSSARQLQQALGDYLSSVGLSHPADELGWFFLDPPAYREKLVGRLVESQLRSAERMLGSGELAKALSCLNQVLALDAGNQRASQLLARMNRAKRRRYLVRRGAAVGGFAAALTALAAGALSLHKRSVRSDEGQTLAASAPAADSIANEKSSAPPTASGESRSAPVPSGAAESAGHALTSVKPSDLLPKGVGGKSREPAKPSNASTKAGAAAKVTLLFRPYGFAQIDGGERRPENTQHDFRLAPGAHRLVYGCPFCEDETTTIDVASSGGTLRFQLQPKPASLRIRYEPLDATVKLGGKSKSVAEAADTPFQVPFPRGDAQQQQVTYEVTRPGFKSTTGTITVSPGQSKTLEGRLEPE